MPSLPPSLLGAGSFVLSLIATRIGILLAHRYALHAIPDERSSHALPTPRIGGIGIALPVLLYLAYRTLTPQSEFGETSPRGYLPLLLAGGVAFFLVGLLDDLLTLSPRAKLAGQLVAALLSYEVIRPLLLFGDTSVSSFDRVLAIGFAALWCLWVVGFVNAFNFMDGMNGKAGLFAVITLVSCVLILGSTAVSDETTQFLSHPTLLIPYLFHPLIYAALGAIAGFLFFNARPKASIFLGDGGSHFLGYLIAAVTFLGCRSLIGTGPSLLVFTILLMPFLYDVAFTLVKRFREGKTVWQAHREHLYQRLMVAGLSHMRVLAICGLTYVACAALAIVAASSASFLTVLLCVLLSVAVMVAYTAYVHRIEKRQVAAPEYSAR